MDISQFRNIAETRNGTVLIDGKSRDTDSPQLKTASLKGRFVRFFKGESSSRNAEVKKAFIEAVRAEYGEVAADSVKNSLGSNRKALTTRTIQKVLEHREFVKESMKDIGRQMMQPMIPNGTEMGTDKLDELLVDLDEENPPREKTIELRELSRISNSEIDGLVDDLDSPSIQELKSPLPKNFLVTPSRVSVEEGKVRLELEGVTRVFEGPDLFDLTFSGEPPMQVGQFNDLRESLSPAGRKRAESDPIPEEEMEKLLRDLNTDSLEMTSEGDRISEGIDFTGKTDEETRKNILGFLFESDVAGELVVDRKTAGEIYVSALKEDSRIKGVDFSELDQLLEELNK